MSFFQGLHFYLAPLILLSGGLGTVWGIVLLIRKRGSDRVMRWLMYVTAGLGVLQALVGGVLFLFFGARPADQLHYVYGLIVLVLIPVAFVYADNKSARRDLIVYTIAIFFVTAAAVRALMTGGAAH
jgi:heme A synthase